MPHRQHPPLTVARHKHVPRIEARRVRRISLSLIAGISTSIVAHCLLLLSSFALPEGVSKLSDQGLQIVLVNAKHARAPHDAQALAQANTDGGGDTATPDMPTSPLLREHADLSGDALQDATKRVEALEARQREIQQQLNSKTVVDSNSRQRGNNANPLDSPRNGSADQDLTRAMAQQEAIVDRHLREYAQRPRKTFVSPRTKESRLAMYAETWRQAVEKMGTLKFPRDSAGKPIYGSVLLTVEIGRSGKVLDISVDRSSGSRKLDDAAKQIVLLASPFPPLPPEITRTTDILVLPRTFYFMNNFGETSLDVRGDK